MKKLIFILLYFIPSILIGQTNYYVKHLGVDDPSRGSYSQPFATLSYACTRVSPGDQIFLLSNITDGDRCDVPVNVNISGNGGTVYKITTDYVATSPSDAYLRLYSGSLTNGNQSISYIDFDGSGKSATRAMYVAFRSNVKVHHCTFSNFLYQGIRFCGWASWNTAPTVPIPTGNEVYNCTFTSCANMTQHDGGHIRPEGQNGMKIHDNIFIQTGASLGSNTDIFAGWQNEGLQIYNNVFTKNSYENGANNFFAELHYSRGGFQLYNNTFNGAACFDYSGSVVGTWGFGGKIYDNVFQTTTTPPTDANNQAYLDLESFTYENDVYVYRNYFKYGRMAININNMQTSGDNIWIYDNIIENIGNSTNSYSEGIKIESKWYGGGEVPIPINNIYVYNNVIDCGVASYAGIGVDVMGTITNLNIRNNIITGSFGYPIRFDATGTGRSVNTLNINNNNFYGTSSLSIYYGSGITFTGRTETGNITTDPNFVSATDFHLKSSSPTIGAGMYIALPTGNTDYDKNTWFTPPSIGAFEYTTGITTPEVTTNDITNITSTTAVSGRTIISDGKGTIIVSGICWSTSTNPTTADYYATNGPNSGPLTMEGLVPSTTYYVRAYATNSAGTGYGGQKSFKAGSTAPVTGIILKHSGILIKHNNQLVKVK